jgi:hypothetical protein
MTQPAAPQDSTHGEQQGLPIAVPVLPTGDARVDAALERLQELDQVPIEEHAEVFGDIHVRLSAALGDAGSSVSGADS